MTEELKVGEIFKDADQKKVDELAAKAKEFIADDPKATTSEIAHKLEHYFIFGTTDLNSVIQEEGAPRHEHYKLDDLIKVAEEAMKE